MYQSAGESGVETIELPKKQKGSITPQLFIVIF
jgi:hypothetical protein